MVHATLRTSKPNMVQAQALRVAPSSLQEEIHLFLEGRKISDVYVSQNVRSVQSFSPTDKVYVGSRLGPVPSGYLILRADSPAIYWNTKIGIAHILKLVFDRRQVEKVGSIVLSATYYGNERKMVLEDVLYHNGSLIWSTLAFDERWKLLKNICRFVIKPDTMGIQGFDVSVTKLESLETWCNRVDYKDVFMWEFFVDKARTRRLLWRSDPAPVIHPIPSATRQTIPIIPIVQHVGPLIARVEKDTSLNLPDSYVLYADNNVNIGAPSVKKLTISLALRSAAPCNVRVEYNDTFKKYEVVEVVENTQSLSPQAAFEKRT